MIEQAGARGINTFVYLPAFRLGLDPVAVGRDWTVVQTVEALRALTFRSVLDWASSPPDPKR